MNTTFSTQQLDCIASVVCFLREHRRKRLAALVYRFFVPDVPMTRPDGVADDEVIEGYREAYQEEIAA